VEGSVNAAEWMTTGHSGDIVDDSQGIGKVGIQFMDFFELGSAKH
jgi:hypothetical protein